MTIRYRSESERPKGEAAAAPAAPPSGLDHLHRAGLRPGDPGPAAGAAADRRAGDARCCPAPSRRPWPTACGSSWPSPPSLPLVTADLTVKTGAWADPKGLSGAASMTADMLTEGTRTRSAPRSPARSRRWGRRWNPAPAWRPPPSPSTSCPTSSRRDGHHGRRGPQPGLRPEELERQRAQALDGLQVSYQEPGAGGGLRRRAAGVRRHALRPRAGRHAGVPAAAQDHGPSAIHQACYRPDNAILVLTGDITPGAGLRHGREGVRRLGEAGDALPAAAGDQAPATPRAIAIDLPGTGQAAVTVVKPGIARNDPDYYTGMVANTVLGGGYSARLNLEIRVKRGLSYGASSRLSANRTTGMFRAAAQTKNESATQVLDLIKRRDGQAWPPSPPGRRSSRPASPSWWAASAASSPPPAAWPTSWATWRSTVCRCDEITRYTAQGGGGAAGQVQGFAGEARSRQGQRHRRRRRQGLRAGPEGQTAGAGGDPGDGAGPRPALPAEDQIVDRFAFDGLSLFGLAAVCASLLCYVMETRSAWWTLGFAAANLAAAVYGFLQGAWPFGLIELFWTGAALMRWRKHSAVS